MVDYYSDTDIDNVFPSLPDGRMIMMIRLLSFMPTIRKYTPNIVEKSYRTCYLPVEALCNGQTGCPFHTKEKW